MTEVNYKPCNYLDWSVHNTEISYRLSLSCTNKKAHHDGKCLFSRLSQGQEMLGQQFVQSHILIVVFRLGIVRLAEQS